MSAPEGKDERLLTMASGGWVIILAASVCLVLTFWAVAPAVFQLANPAPGDGRDVNSYGFDLSVCLVDPGVLVPAMKHRDMVPVMDAPEVITADEVDRINREERGKYLVTSDRVIGVVVDGVARAYPISVLNVHEIVHDTLGSRPIAVTYQWLCDSVMVFDRTAGGDVLTFGNSGLVYNSNLLMYDREPAAGESLWLQLDGRAVTGPAAEADSRLETLPYQLTTWGAWRKTHPETTVIARRPEFLKRYKHASPATYFRSEKLRFPFEPPIPAEGPGAKTRVLAVAAGDARRVYPLPYVAARTDAQGHWEDELGQVTLRFSYQPDGDCLTVATTAADEPIESVHAFWFAWHAMNPGDELAQ